MEFLEAFCICTRILDSELFIEILKLVMSCWIMRWTQRYQTLEWQESLAAIKMKLILIELLEHSKYKPILPYTCTDNLSKIMLVDWLKFIYLTSFFNSGYMAPEYAMEGVFSVKSDVFSFGVLLLEIISGKRNSGFYLSEHGQSLLTYVCGLFLFLWAYS